MAKKSPKDSPLAVKVTGGKLVISIGINTLAWACDPANGGKLGDWKVKEGSEMEWAKDVAHEMEHEEGDFDAQSRVGKWLDEMADCAAESGSCALEENNKDGTTN
jgi:hypothetical protein